MISPIFIFCFFVVLTVCNCNDQERKSFFRRNLLAAPTHLPVVNHTKNEMSVQKNLTIVLVDNGLSSPKHTAGAEAAILIIVGIVLLSIIGMIVYFIRKFEQLNKHTPTFRYSSLKTEVNGLYEADAKTESQALVNVSTEEEDYYDDDDEDEENICPPTLLVRSQQTVTANSKIFNGTVNATLSNSLTSAKMISKSDTTLDSDDELLQ